MNESEYGVGKHYKPAGRRRGTKLACGLPGGVTTTDVDRVGCRACLRELFRLIVKVAGSLDLPEGERYVAEEWWDELNAPRTVNIGKRTKD